MGKPETHGWLSLDSIYQFIGPNNVTSVDNFSLEPQSASLESYLFEATGHNLSGARTMMGFIFPVSQTGKSIKQVNIDGINLDAVTNARAYLVTETGWKPLPIELRATESSVGIDFGNNKLKIAKNQTLAFFLNIGRI